MCSSVQIAYDIGNGVQSDSSCVGGVHMGGVHMGGVQVGDALEELLIKDKDAASIPQGTQPGTWALLPAAMLCMGSVY